MTIVCVDDHPIMLKGLIQNIQCILPGVRVLAFGRADEALDFVKDNGCDVLPKYFLPSNNVWQYTVNFFSLIKSPLYSNGCVIIKNVVGEVDEFLLQAVPVCSM